MRSLFVLCLLTHFVLKSQPSPLAFTMALQGATHSITCSQNSLTYVLYSDYTLSPVTYSWNNGSVSYTGSLVTVTSPGTYSITAYANPTLSLVQILGVMVNTAVPLSSVGPLSQSITCSSSITPVTGSSPVMYPLHYFVSPSGGTTSIQGTTANYIPGAPGTYTHLLVDELNGCKTEKTFTVNGSAGFPTFSVVSAENFSLGCSTKSVAAINITQASTSPPGGTLSYTITSSPSYVPGNISTYSFNTAGIYTVIVKDNTTNCESKVPVSIIANTFVPYPAISGFPETITCNKSSLKLQYIPINQGNYSFGWGVPGFPTPPVLNHPYDTITVFADPNPGVTVVSAPWAMLTDNNSLCSHSISYFVPQDMLPPLITSIHKSYPAISCIHPYVTLTAYGQSSFSGFPQGVVAPYLWEGPPPQITGTLGSGYNAYTPGTYTVHVVDYKSGCTNQDTVYVADIRDYPNVSAPLQPFELCETLVTIQPVNSSTIPLVFLWNSGTNTAVSNPTPYQLTTGSIGVYTVVVTNTANSCSVSIQLTVGICTGVDENTGEVFPVTLFPNPTNEFIYIETSLPLRGAVTDMFSKMLTDISLEKGKNKLNLESYPPGVYFIHLWENKNTIKTLKFVKQN